ncbi:hypothetical protein [Arthrobacter sp. 31Y]|uniref:hypothetical protein n=1 Tax=Arthrobacter sp. 31Y TaxID=1115632 RepID=UPI000463460B|nr:hypothetical protein [Arthrobacter sp. 31Y]
MAAVTWDERGHVLTWLEQKHGGNWEVVARATGDTIMVRQRPSVEVVQAVVKAHFLLRDDINLSAWATHKAGPQTQDITPL